MEDRTLAAAAAVFGTGADPGPRVDLLGAATPGPVITSLGATPNVIPENGSTALNGTITEGGPPDAHTVRIDWGDGSTATSLTLNAGTNTFNASHPYLNNRPNNAPFVVTVTVEDSAGAGTTATTSVEVDNVLPSDVQVDLSAASINENDSVTLSGRFSDPGTLDTHEVTVFWGPGEGSTTIPLAAGVLTFGASHQYFDNAPGTSSSSFPVSVSVLDEDALPAISGPPSAGNFRFGQLDWYDAQGNLQVPHSSWGTVEADVVGDPQQTVYLNVAADAGHGPAWIVQNLPIFADLTNESADFDISQLGVPSGTALTSLTFVATVGSAVRTTMPAGTMTSAPVTALAEKPTGDAKLNQPALPASVGTPAGIHILFPISNLIEHTGVPGVQEGVKQCLAGATARSVAWLNTTYNMGANKTAQQIYQDLEAINNSTAPYADFLKAKAAYLSNLAAAAGLTAETKVLDLIDVGAVDGVTHETGKDVKQWIQDELNRGEDVELDFDSHIVTVTGMFDFAGMTYLKYRDDEVQGDDTKGDDGTKLGKLQQGANGAYEFRPSGNNAFFNVRLVMSESVFKKTVTVTNVPPAAGALATSAATITADGAVTVTGHFTDPGTLDTHRVTIAWGDGSPATTVSLPAGALDYSASHVYARANAPRTAYAIQATVTDQDGAASTTSASVRVLLPTQTIRVHGRTVVLGSLADGDIQIEILDKHGKPRRQIVTSNPASVLTFDHRVVVVETLANGGARISLFTEDGKAVRRNILTGNPTQVTASGNHLLVTQQLPGGGTQVAVLDENGKRVKRKAKR